jgi:hypothetical protein
MSKRNTTAESAAAKTAAIATEPDPVPASSIGLDGDDDFGLTADWFHASPEREELDRLESAKRAAVALEIETSYSVLQDVGQNDLIIFAKLRDLTAPIYASAYPFEGIQRYIKIAMTTADLLEIGADKVFSAAMKTPEVLDYLTMYEEQGDR